MQRGPELHNACGIKKKTGAFLKKYTCSSGLNMMYVLGMAWLKFCQCHHRNCLKTPKEPFRSGSTGYCLAVAMVIRLVAKALQGICHSVLGGR